MGVSGKAQYSLTGLTGFYGILQDYSILSLFPDERENFQSTSGE